MFAYSAVFCKKAENRRTKSWKNKKTENQIVRFINTFAFLKKTNLTKIGKNAQKNQRILQLFIKNAVASKGENVVR